MKKENMGYESSINSNDLRSELDGKVSLEKMKKETRKVEVNLVDTLALNDLIQKINAYDISDEDRRSEIVDKFCNTQDDSFRKRQETPKLDEKEKNAKVDSLIDDRSEINGKFDNNEKSKEHSTLSAIRREMVEVKFEDTIALKDVIKDVEKIKLNEEDKRTELKELINNKETINKESDEFIKTDVDKIEAREDKIQEATENISLIMVIMIVMSCLVIGSVVGYMLYRIALNG